MRLYNGRRRVRVDSRVRVGGDGGSDDAWGQEGLVLDRGKTYGRIRPARYQLRGMLVFSLGLDWFVRGSRLGLTLPTAQHKPSTSLLTS